MKKNKKVSLEDLEADQASADTADVNYTYEPLGTPRWRFVGGDFVSRMSVINKGKYLNLFPNQTIVDKWKANDWIFVTASCKRNKAGEVVGIYVAKSNGSGFRIRYPDEGRKGRTHVPVPVGKMGIAVVAEGSPSGGECEVEVDGDGFLFRLRDGITFAKKEA